MILFKSPMFRRVLRNFGVVIRGRGIAGVFSVLATGLMANALSPTEFGLVILLHTYVMVIRGALNFRTFEAVVRFGIPLNDSGNEQGFRSLLRSTMLIDILSALLATLVGVLAAPLAGQFLHLDADMVTAASFYSLVILFTANGTPNGVLRVYDRFDALGIQFTVAPTLRFFMVAVAWALDAPIEVFIVVWGSAFAMGHLYMLVRGLKELKAHVETSLWSGFRLAELKKPETGFWGFVGVVYWQTGIDLLPKHVSVLLAGNLLGPAAAGLFRLAREFSTVLTQPAVTLREVLFPDLTRSFLAEDGGIQSIPFKTAAVAGVAGLAIVLFSVFFGAPILGIIGEEYIPAAPLLSMLLLAATFDLASSPLRAAAYAIGKAGAVLKIHVLGIISYVVLFFLLTPLTGLTGPGWAAIIASVLALGMTAKLISGYSHQSTR